MLARFAAHSMSIGLGALGAGCILRGSIHYLPGVEGGGEGAMRLLTVDGAVPQGVIAVVWIVAGIVALSAAFRRRYRRCAGNLVGGLMLTWGMAAFAAWAVGMAGFGAIVTAGVYLCWAVTILAWTHLRDPALGRGR